MKERGSREVPFYEKFLTSTKPRKKCMHNFGPWVQDLNLKKHLSPTIFISVKYLPPCKSYFSFWNLGLKKAGICYLRISVGREFGHSLSRHICSRVFHRLHLSLWDKIAVISRCGWRRTGFQVPSLGYWQDSVSRGPLARGAQSSSPGGPLHRAAHTWQLASSEQTRE